MLHQIHTPLQCATPYRDPHAELLSSEPLLAQKVQYSRSLSASSNSDMDAPEPRDMPRARPPTMGFIGDPTALSPSASLSMLLAMERRLRPAPAPPGENDDDANAADTP